MKGRSARELCAMLITRAMKDLNEDEEEIVVDYLTDLGVDVNIDAKPKDLCIALLEKTMIKDMGKKVPLTAYANSLLGKKEVETQKEVDKKVQNISEERKKAVKSLESKSRELPGCLVSGEKIVAKTLYDFQVDNDMGIEKLPDGTLQYSAAISVSEDLYDEIFLAFERPVLELVSSKGERAYARISYPHSGPKNLVQISPLIANILNIKGNGSGFLKLCISLPEIKKIDFTFYGTDQELQSSLKNIISQVPYVINAFSYLSLGLILSVNIEGKEVQLRVDGLQDADERPIFAGIIPSFESDIPFDIKADL